MEVIMVDWLLIKLGYKLPPLEPISNRGKDGRFVKTALIRAQMIRKGL